MTTLDVYNEIQFFSLKELESIRIAINFEIAKKKAQELRDRAEFDKIKYEGNSKQEKKLTR